MNTQTVGVLGGGQLGRMLAQAASCLNVDIVVLDSGAIAPAKQVVSPRDPSLSHLDGSFADPAKIRSLAAQVDVLTVETEHVDVNALKDIDAEQTVAIHPSPSTIAVIQDKFLQKLHLRSHGCIVVDYVPVDSTVDAIQECTRTLGLPYMLKSRTLAYDGRGNFVVRALDQADQALETLRDRPLYAEKWVPFVKEIAVMVVRTVQGEVSSYPAVETVHKDNICHLVFAPLRSRDPSVFLRAQQVAEAAVKTFQGAGIYGVEMFLLEDGSIYINEIAPRPHNSGHYTIEACETSQFENHLRAILGLPLGSTALKVPSAAMLNILGVSSSMGDLGKFLDTALRVPGCTLHLYGKSESRKGRKMGHVTIVGDSDATVCARLRPLLTALPGYDDDDNAEEVDLQAPPPQRPGSGYSSEQPLVGIIMGSDSDLPVMLPAAHILDEFAVPYELTIVSAHRTPERLFMYARSARARGLRTIVAGAGGAAHLPGMVAAMTELPVVGVPVKGSSLDGVDSLYSIVQMPRGVPVATVTVNGGMNAGLLAVRVLSVSMPHLSDALAAYQKRNEDGVMDKVNKLEEVGWEEYKVQR